MKIIITGCHGALSQNISNTLMKDKHLVMCLDERDESNVNNVIDLLSDSEVFINCGYRDNVQSILFEKIYNHWRYEKKTIVNILTSAIVFGGENTTYIENKKELESLTIKLRDQNKEVRVINVYPNTLETRKSIPYNTLKLDDISKTIKWVLSLPHEIEIFQIGISRTKTLRDDLPII